MLLLFGQGMKIITDWKCKTTATLSSSSPPPPPPPPPPSSTTTTITTTNTKVKVNQSRYRPGVAQRVPGS